jgi:serine/threonine-protein kinase
MNLADWLRRSPRPAIGEQLALVVALAQAVEDGHRASHQYAGWSPSQIKIKGDGSVDLSAIDSDKGSEEDLAYAAPESAGGREYTPRSDVYSAGVLLYEILSGGHPFGGASVEQPRGAAKPLSELRRDLPQDLTDAITACLERDPNWRPADLSFVLQVARETAGKMGGKVAPPAATAAPSAARRTVPTSPARRDVGPTPTFGGRPAHSSPPSRLPLVIAGVLIAVSAGVAFWMFRRPPQTVEPGTTSTPTAAPATPPPAVASATAAPTVAPTKAVGGTKPAVTSAAPSTSTQAPVTAAPATIAPIAEATLAPTPAPIVNTPANTTAPMVNTAPPTAPPATVTTVAEAAGPIVLKSISPLKARRGYNQLFDVRGDNLRADSTITMTKAKGKSDPGDVMVVRRKLADPTLLQVLVNVAANAPTGPYTVVASDGQGRTSNPVSFEVTQ